MQAEILALAPIWYVVFIFSLTCHEAAHAFAAKLGGDDTAFLGGQVSLNPIPHMRRSPFGTILVPIVSLFLSGWMIGWASAPYDPLWQQRYPRRAAYMALAGPLANVALVLLAALIIKIGLGLGVFTAPRSVIFTGIVDAQGGAAGAIATFLSILFSLNLLLAIFNLIPVPPLDGHTVVGLFMNERTALRFYDFTHNSSFMFLGIFIAWKVIGAIFMPAFVVALNLLYPGAGYH